MLYGGADEGVGTALWDSKEANKYLKCFPFFVPGDTGPIHYFLAFVNGKYKTAETQLCLHTYNVGKWICD